MAVVSSQSQKSQLCLSLNRLEADRQFYFLQVCQLSRKRLLIGHNRHRANNDRHIANEINQLLATLAQQEKIILQDC